MVEVLVDELPVVRVRAGSRKVTQNHRCRIIMAIPFVDIAEHQVEGFLRVFVSIVVENGFLVGLYVC